MGFGKTSAWGANQDDGLMSLSTEGIGCETCISPAKLHGSSENGTSAASEPSSSSSFAPDDSSAVDEVGGVSGPTELPSQTAFRLLVLSLSRGLIARTRPA